MLLRLPHSTIACLLLSYLKYLMDYAHLQQQQQQSLQLSHLAKVIIPKSKPNHKESLVPGEVEEEEEEEEEEIFLMEVYPPFPP